MTANFFTRGNRMKTSDKMKEPNYMKVFTAVNNDLLRSLRVPNVTTTASCPSTVCCTSVIFVTSPCIISMLLRRCSGSLEGSLSKAFICKPRQRTNLLYLYAK